MSQPPPIYIQFAVRGLDDVQRAVKGIAETALNTQKKSKAAAKATQDETKKAAAQAAAAALQTWKFYEGEARKARTAGLADVSAHFAKQAKIAKTAAKAQVDAIKFVASAEEVARKRAAANITSWAKSDRAAEKKRVQEHISGQNLLMESRRKAMVAQHTAEEKAKTKLANAKPQAGPGMPKKPGDSSVAGINKLAREIEGNDAKNALKAQRQRESAERYVARLRTQYFAEQQAAEEAAAKKRQAEAEKRAKTLIQGVGRGANAAGGILKGAVTGAMNAAGGFSAQDAVQNEVRLQGQAAALSASSTGVFSAKDILSSSRAVATQYGFDTSDVMRSVDEVKKMTGNTQMGMDVAPFLAKLANATGSDIGELGGLAGNILAGNEKISQADMERQLSIFARQGMVGGVEVADLAKYGGRLTAGAKLFGGDMQENETTLGAFAQIARQHGGASSAAEAALSAQRFGSMTAQKASDLKGMGIDVMNGDVLKDPEEIAMEMVSKTHGNVEKLGGLKLGERANKVLFGLGSIYRDAGGGKEGEAAMHKEVQKYRGALSTPEIDERSRTRMQAADKQIAVAMEQLKGVVGEQLVPELTRFITEVLVPNIPNIKILFQQFARFADFLLSQPLAGVGAIVAASIAKEFAVAFATSKFTELLKTNSTALNALGAAAGLATAAILAKEAIDADAKNKDKKNKDRSALLTEVLNLQASGQDKTPEGRAKAAALLEKLKASQADMNNDADNPSAVKKAVVGVASIIPGAGGLVQEMQDLENQARSKENKALTEAIKGLTTMIETAGPPRPPGPADPNHPGRGNSGPVGSTTRTRPK